MKSRLIIVVLIFIINCKAQSIIVPLGSGEDYEFNSSYYIKDVNDEFAKFVGTWKYQNNETEIIIKLKKELYYQVSSDSEFEDMLVGEYSYFDSGIELVNTLEDFNNPLISGYGHNINGGVFIRRLPYSCLDNSTVSEIKVWLNLHHPVQEYTEGRMILHYVNDNGIEKLEACIYDNTTMGNIPDARIDIPDGNYVFVKQN